MVEIVKVIYLKKSFGCFEVLKDVFFIVYLGEVVGFIGLNGFGKFMMIWIFLGIIKKDGGMVMIFG